MKNIPMINHDICTRCLKCVEICPKKVLHYNENRIEAIENECMLCTHCFCVCPCDAISFDETEVKKIIFRSLEYSEKTVDPGNTDPAGLVNAIRSRRSVRKYRKDPVPDEIIADLIEFAVTAPSGTNCQDWQFIAINGREKVWALAQEIKKFFVKINTLAKNPVIRNLSVFFMGNTLKKYYHEHMDSVEMGLRESEKGVDMLFHNAPSLIIVHSEMGGSTPVEDAQYASYHITLLAHAVGLGTCYIGFAVESINRDWNLKKYLDIPMKNRVHAVLTLGYPDVHFNRLSLRKNYRVVWR